MKTEAHVQAFCGSFAHPYGQGCTQSNIFFLVFKGHTWNLKGFLAPAIITKIDIYFLE
jgi:hypothetical protein